MNEDRPSTNGPGHRSWFDRLSQAFLAEPRDREELIKILRDAQNRNLLDTDGLAMIEGVLEVSEMQVRDVMIPRSQMVVLEKDSPPDVLVSAIVKSGHSRFPVIGESLDEVIGIFLAKDMLQYYMEGGRDNFNIREMLRPASFIPESKRLNVLLKDFRASRNHMAIVVDEYGGVAGIITIEDVLEQIVGEIEDEHDYEEGGNILQHSAGHFTVKALTPIEEFNEHFATEFSDEEYDTVGGLVLNNLGYLPKRGEVVHVNGFAFKVLRSDSRRVHLLQVTIEPESEASTDEKEA